MKIFVTGGAGYIGSHTALRLLTGGHDLCIFDNYCNGSPIALARVQELAGREMTIVEGDVCDAGALVDAVSAYRPDAVIHFAGLKAVGESAEKPLAYYRTNVGGSVNLLEAMRTAGCRRIIFSSSATVYGHAQYLPFDEGHPINPTNPYGHSKAMAEQVIGDWTNASPGACAILLRYFNPVGAHESGRIGEDPGGVPNNLMPYVAQVAIGRRPSLSIFGSDYATRDGTGERDYIHVEDLAAAHLAALQYSVHGLGCEAFNIGTGRGHTVRELVDAYERACGRSLPVEFVDRRPGDVESSYTSSSKAGMLLGWQSERDLDAMCSSSWRWQSANPAGYQNG